MKKKILIGIGVFLIFGVIAITIGILNGKSQGLSMDDMLVKAPDIIWKENDNMGIVNLELDGTRSKEYINPNYFEEVANYINSMDKTSLKDYEYIEFKGNVVRDKKVECTIKGNLSILYLKTVDKVSGIDVENNMTDLFIPKPLQ